MTKGESAPSDENQELTCQISPTAASPEQFSSSFAAMYHSIFPPKPHMFPSHLPSPPPPLPLPFSLSPSTVSSPSSASASPPFFFDAESRLLQARLILEYQELADRYESSLSRLHALADELVFLRSENAELKLANAELVRLLRLPSPPPSRSSPSGLLAPLKVTAGNIKDNADEDERTSMPKSISVRSSGYLKIHQRQGSPAASGSSSNRQLDIPSSTEVQHRVIVPAGRGGEGGGSGGRGDGDDQLKAAVKLEVFDQGMKKTELCNKWQQTGTCPYGDHCQFAHGITELRPVIRHPRYKTQVCRMVLAGDVCPYGHRCHFRHSLTDQEMLLAPR